MELDFTNGTVVKLGQKFGVPTPANAVVLRAVHAVERSIEVRLNTEATPEMIADEGFDRVIVVTGFDTMMDAVQAGQNVVVIGGGEVGVTVTEITDGGVRYLDADGTEQFIAVDTVAISTGMKPRRDEALAFYGTTKHFYMIGDCKKPATISTAMRDAFAVASEI